MKSDAKTVNELLVENEDLRARLEVAEETLRAIESGDVDGLVIGGPNGQQFFMLRSALEALEAEKQSRRILLSLIEDQQLEQARFRAFFELDLLGMIVTTIDHRILNVNNKACQILGIDRDLLLQRRWRDFLPPNHAAVDDENFERLLQSQIHSFSVEDSLIREDGLSISASISTGSVRGPDGKVDIILRVFEDTTERREADKQIRRLGELLGQIVESINEVFWMVDLEKGKMLYISPSYEKIWGRTVESLYTSPETWIDAVHPEDRQVVADALPLRVTGGYAVEYRVIRPDGSIRWVHDTAFPVKDASGGVYRVTGIAKDITDRKLVEEALRRTNNDLAVAQRVAAIGSWEWDPLTDSAHWSDEHFRLFGLEPRREPVPFSEFLNFFDERDRAGVRTMIERALETGQTATLDTRITRPDGSVRWMQLRAVVVHNLSGKITGIHGTSQDITDRRLLEQQIFRAQRLESIGTLASGIAHDLNNVLSPIMMGVELLRMEVREKDSLGIIESITRNAQRGADMIKRILTFARGMDGQKTDVLVEQLIDAIEETIVTSFPDSIRCTKSISPNLPPLLADQTQLHQVLLNLCVNARDAMPGGGTIDIGAELFNVDRNFVLRNPEAEEGPHIVIRVEDTGPGIPPDIIDRIFDPFFTTKDIGKGTGLGLSTSMSIVKYHGGFMRVYSDPGKGAKFVVYLPVDPSARTQRKPRMPESAWGDGTGRAILFIDDEDSIVQSARMTLEAFGYRVLTARGGQEALDQHAKNREHISLVITDLMMPEIDGHNIIRFLRMRDPGLRIIAMSGVPAALEAVRTESNVIQVLAKPFTASALLSAVGDAVFPDSDGVTIDAP